MFEGIRAIPSFSSRADAIPVPRRAFQKSFSVSREARVYECARRLSKKILFQINVFQFDNWIPLQFIME